MRKLLIFLTVAALVFGALALAGCGDKTESEVEEVEVVDVNEPIAESVIGIYVEGTDPDSTTGGSLSIKDEGEWEGSAWGSEKEGTYKVETDPQNSIVFTFEDGATETWSIMVGDGKVAAIVSPDGQQYSKVEK